LESRGIAVRACPRRLRRRALAHDAALSQALRALAAVRVDPAGAATMLSAYRLSHGLGPVRLDPALNAMAQRQADAMVAANEMSHDAAGSFSSRLAAAGMMFREPPRISAAAIIRPARRCKGGANP